MHDTNLMLAVFLAILVPLGFWERKNLRTLSDSERLKVMDYQSKVGMWGFLPIPILLGGFYLFCHFIHRAIFPALVVFMVLLAGTSLSRAYLTGKGLAALNISPTYLKVRSMAALIRGVAMAAFFGFLLWNTFQVFRQF